MLRFTKKLPICNNIEMTEKTAIQLKGNMSFEISLDGHKFMIDSSEEFGGENKGPKPKSLMLAALGGCTGMDMASMLRKMRVVFEDLKIEVSGEVTEEHPKHFESMHITYIIKGKDLPREKIEMAIDLSQNKYCGVSYTYRDSIKITHDLIINE